MRHLIATAAAWGGNPNKDTIYLNATPANNERFLAITVYNAEGYLEVNPLNRYSLNNLTAQQNPDGSVTVLFGGDGKGSNSLPIMPGWNYVVRFYRPRPEIVDGSWHFRSAQPVEAVKTAA